MAQLYIPSSKNPGGLVPIQVAAHKLGKEHTTPNTCIYHISIYIYISHISYIVYIYIYIYYLYVAAIATTLVASLPTFFGVFNPQTKHQRSDLQLSSPFAPFSGALPVRCPVHALSQTTVGLVVYGHHSKVLLPRSAEVDALIQITLVPFSFSIVTDLNMTLSIGC